MPGWVKSAVLLGGIFLVAMNCLVLVRARGHLTRLNSDLRTGGTTHQEASAKQRPFVRSVGRATIHIALGNFLIVTALWNSGTLSKRVFFVLISSTGLVLFVTVTFLG
jgi:hypothetical protein